MPITLTGPDVDHIAKHHDYADRIGECDGCHQRKPLWDDHRPADDAEGQWSCCNVCWSQAMKRAKARQAAIVESWYHLLRGLWLSGLRLGEAVNLHWTDERKLCVDLTGRRPMFRIRAEAEKGNKDRVLPLSPEFAEFLLTTPEDERHGYVFNPLPRRSQSSRLRLQAVSDVIREIGKTAGGEGGGEGEVRFRPRFAPGIRLPLGRPGHAGHSPGDHEA